MEYHEIKSLEQIVNTRDSTVAHVQIRQDAESYIDFLDHADNESFRLPELISYLKRLESSRGNSIITYIPQYEELFRTYGY